MQCSRHAVLFLALAASALVCGCSSGDDFRITDEMREQAMRHADSAVLIESAEALRRWHAERRTGIRLEPGIGERSLELTLGGLPCTLPDELLTLWRWHDGESSDAFIWYHEFLSLRESIDEYRALRWSPLSRWHRDWFPVLRFQGEWFFVECAQTLRAASPVMHYFVEDEPRYAFVNLTTMLRTVAEAARSGALAVDDEGNVRDDVAAIAAIHRRLNPGASFPYAMP